MQPMLAKYRSQAAMARFGTASTFGQIYYSSRDLNLVRPEPGTHRIQPVLQPTERVEFATFNSTRSIGHPLQAPRGSGLARVVVRALDTLFKRTTTCFPLAKILCSVEMLLQEMGSRASTTSKSTSEGSQHGPASLSGHAQSFRTGVPRSAPESSTASPRCPTICPGIPRFLLESAPASLDLPRRVP